MSNISAVSEVAKTQSEEQREKTQVTQVNAKDEMLYDKVMHKLGNLGNGSGGSISFGATISFIINFIFNYIKYYIGRMLAPWFFVLSYLNKKFIGRSKMTHDKFIANIETNEKHVFHYLINNKTKLKNGELEQFEKKRKNLLDFVLTRYTCQLDQQFNNNDFRLVNENVIFSDPMIILKNRKQFETVFKMVSMILESKIDERCINISHFQKCVVMSFNIQWMFLKNPISVQPQILIIVTNDVNDTFNYQSDLEFIKDVKILNENLKKEELTFYKKFPKYRDENPIVNEKKNEENVGVDLDAEAKKKDFNKNQQIIAIYDFWMSDHHYSLLGFYKYLRRIIGIKYFLASLIFNFVVEKYNDFKKKQHKKKVE